ncbi:MAG: gas vesicle protein [Planctomycetota bacterium]
MSASRDTLSAAANTSLSAGLTSSMPASRPASKPASKPTGRLDAEPAVSLCETLDRVLTKGVVAKGEVTISVAGVDLIYVGVGALISSVDSALGFVRTDPLPETPRGDDA